MPKSRSEKANSVRRRRRALGVSGAVVAVLAVGALASPASAATLKGAWAPFDRCPVDAASMLAADGQNTVASCNVADSPNGSIKLGNATATTGDTNLQFGLLVPSSGSATMVAPAGGAAVSAPVSIPGGLLGLMCPSNVPVISQICDGITNSTLNKVTATVQPAGDPSGFSLGAGTSVGQPILTMPVKIKLSNPFLASTCSIGTDSDPIVLKPQNESAPAVSFLRFDADGTPDTAGAMGATVLKGTLRDDTFAVPAAKNCGLAGVIDLAVNLKEGLPSKSGDNHLVLNNSTTYALGGFASPHAQAPGEGQKLSDAWHAAVQ
ncbi:MAG TPA: hypothetical protein VGL93_16750 [Streptosporangiaceae bacterium]|jgi:hypothetical protein